MTVFKYAIDVRDELVVQMPIGAKILSFHVQHDTPCVWAIVDPAAPLEPRHFRLAGTGHPIEESVESLRFVGTVLMFNDSLVFHLFEIVTEETT